MLLHTTASMNVAPARPKQHIFRACLSRVWRWRSHVPQACCVHLLLLFATAVDAAAHSDGALTVVPGVNRMQDPFSDVPWVVASSSSE